MSGDFEKEMLVRTGRLMGTVEQMDKKLDGLSVRVAALEAHPRKRLDAIFQALLGTVGGFVAGLFSPFARG